MYRGDAGELRLEVARRVAADQGEALDAVGDTLRLDLLDLLDLGVPGGDDQLAALVVGNAVRGTIRVEQAPSVGAVKRAKRAGRVVDAAMDHLAVARGRAGADPFGGLGDDHLVTLECGGACNRQPDHARAD